MTIFRRFFVALLAMLLAVPAAAAPDWVHTFAATPEGGFRIGNPAARIKLVEYGSLSCPHCGVFHAESGAALNSKYIAPGLVSLEFRPFVLNQADFVATVVARCGGDPRVFFARTDTFYDAQTDWVPPFFDVSDADKARLESAPDQQRALVLGQIARLDTFVAAHGIPPARFAQCLTDQKAIDRLTALQLAANRVPITGTPTFFINGVRDTGAPTWSNIEAKLAAALARPSR